MKYFLIASAATLALLAGTHVAGAQSQTTDPAHPLANPQAPAPDCRSDSTRGANVPCGPTNRVEPNGAQGKTPKGQ
jgi:hypothetical protein